MPGDTGEFAIVNESHLLAEHLRQQFDFAAEESLLVESLRAQLVEARALLTAYKEALRELQGAVRPALAPRAVDGMATSLPLSFVELGQSVDAIAVEVFGDAFGGTSVSASEASEESALVQIRVAIGADPNPEELAEAHGKFFRELSRGLPAEVVSQVTFVVDWE